MNMTEEYNRLIGKRVKMQRISAKVSQTELAKELGVTQTHLSNIENGRAGLTIPNLIKLHQILECPISSFFVDIEGEKEADNSSDITLENVMELARLLKQKAKSFYGFAFCFCCGSIFRKAVFYSGRNFGIHGELSIYYIFFKGAIR